MSFLLYLFAHLTEQRHIAAGGYIPAEVLLHIPLLQRPEGLGIFPVQMQATLDGSQEIVAVVALEGKAQAVFALFVYAGDACTTGTVP